MSDFAEQELVDDGTLPPDDFHDCIDRTREVAQHELEIPFDILQRLEAKVTELLVEPSLLREAAAALAVGHVVVQGPPGTGKSTLARALCEAFGADYLPVTAHEDWSSYEVIGRHELRVDARGNETIVGVNGFFTEAAIRCAGSLVRHSDNGSEPQATWLVIDELNRAQPDRAFGELFTVLGTHEPVAVTLLHQPIGNNTLVPSRRFRLIATVNTVDKQFVNALSQGLRRRFTFLTMDIPRKRDPGEAWGSDGDAASTGAREFSVVLEAAARRMAGRKMEGLGTLAGPSADQLEALLKGSARSLIESVFELAELIRYSTVDEDLPYVPIGTAPLIDTIELFLSRVILAEMKEAVMNESMDWAVAVKLVPLLDADTTNRPQLLRLAEKLPEPFRGRTKEEVLRIASDGLHYVG